MSPARDVSMLVHAIASFLIVVAIFLVTDSASAPSLASPHAHGARSDSPSPFTAAERRTGSWRSQRHDVRSRARTRVD